ncbi:hypothetical protein [Actinobacillus equuli]|uniref:DUF7210 family protein n=1 Tax=Actinobacillus equuli TaxID=718 RepID=UPI0024414251|nr:hypothetical protein [Actinobacillus equuli]WGE52381.1 hypothetical protein NYR69_08000 [Actinobacillus equuli subsp. haemolyticus]
MPKFIVKNTPILHNGKRYEIGDKIEMTAEEAENNALYLQADEDEAEAARLAAEKAEAERLAEEEKARLAAEEAEKEAKKTAKSKEK